MRTREPLTRTERKPLTRTKGKRRPKKDAGVVKREKLVEVLALLQPGLAQKGFLEQTTHFLFMDKSICTFNEVVCISVPFDVGFTCTVLAKPIYKLLDKLSVEDITIAKEEGQVVVRGTDVEFGVAAVEDDTVPLMVEALRTEDLKWKKLPKHFVEAVGLCCFSASSDMTHPAITGINITGADVISSDRYRISWYQGKDKIAKDFLLPAIAAVDLVKYEPVKYSLVKGWVHFQNEAGIVFSSRTVDAEFPEIEKFFPTKKVKIIELPKTELTDMLHRAKVLVESDFVLDRRIKLVFKGSTIDCSVVKKDLGHFHESISLPKILKKDFEILVNPDFLQEALKAGTLELAVMDESVILFSKTFKHLISLV
jgi:DNA polymerase III sliding clamp (beta) subunit (PCNA family)